MLTNAWREHTRAPRTRAALTYREDSDASLSSVQTTTGALEKREYLDCGPAAPRFAKQDPHS